MLSIAHSALAVTKVLIGEPPGVLKTTCPSNSAVETVQQVIIQQSKYWSCMSIKSVLPGQSLPFRSDEPTADDRKDLIRQRPGQSRLHGKIYVLLLCRKEGINTTIQTDVIRIYQSKVLADKHSMYELAVLRPKERVSKSFQDQVLARYKVSPYTPPCIETNII